MGEDVQPYDVGEYGALVARPNPSGLVIITVPDFESALRPDFEKKRGRKLTEQELKGELQQAPAIALTKQEAEQMTASRKNRI